METGIEYKIILLNTNKYIHGKLTNVENGILTVYGATIFEPTPVDEENPWLHSFPSSSIYVSLSSVFYMSILTK